MSLEEYDIEGIEELSEHPISTELEAGVLLERLGEYHEGIEELETGDRIAGDPQEDMDELSRRMEEYYTEFEENGIDNIKVEN